jgi:molybdenum cofactor cytidylyltransferase
VRTAGLVAAAGASTRMGTCKALLPFYSEDTCFVDRIARVMLNAALAPVVVTVPSGPDAGAIAHRLAELPVVCSENDRPKDGLTGSVVTALAHARDCEAIVIAPVDCPFVDVELVRALLAGLRLGVAAVPYVDGTRGHPVAFARPTFELLWACAGRGGPRSVLDALGPDVIEIPWSDPRVADDVDTPADYERLFGTKLPPFR